MNDKQKKTVSEDDEELRRNERIRAQMNFLGSVERSIAENYNRHLGLDENLVSSIDTPGVKSVLQIHNMIKDMLRNDRSDVNRFKRKRAESQSAFSDISMLDGIMSSINKRIRIGKIERGHYIYDDDDDTDKGCDGELKDEVESKEEDDKGKI